MTTTYAEIMQAARNLHDHIRHTRFGQAQDIFDYTAPFHPGNHVFHDDADTGDEVIEERALLRVGGGLHLHLKQRFEGAIDPGQSQV